MSLEVGGCDIDLTNQISQTWLNIQHVSSTVPVSKSLCTMEEMHLYKNYGAEKNRFVSTARGALSQLEGIERFELTLELGLQELY